MIAMFCIGTPGQCPRMFITTDEVEARAQLHEGEVCFNQANYVAAPHIINAEGSALVVAGVPLDVQREAKWIEARNYRDAYSTSGCTTALGRVDTNTDAQRNINGAATAAMIAKVSGVPFSVDWTMADNSVVTHNEDQMIAMGLTVVGFLSACQKAGTAIRDKIAVADIAGLSALDITGGYPANGA